MAWWNEIDGKGFCGDVLQSILARRSCWNTAQFSRRTMTFLARPDHPCVTQYRMTFGCKRNKATHEQPKAIPWHSDKLQEQIDRWNAKGLPGIQKPFDKKTHHIRPSQPAVRPPIL